MKLALPLAAGLALAGVLGACAADPSQGYSFATTHDETVRTVSVPIFANSTFETGVEAELTEAVVKRIQQDTPWRVASDTVADTELVAEITDVGLRTLSRTRGTGLPQEQTYEITVDFTWRDNRAGTVLVERRRFTAAGAYVPDRLTGERIDVGRREAVGELARAIVAELRSDW
ncbi:MAG: hypothetical protein DHS20C14_14290 [Phycisphaeraceae bacterium]|nr:MAG: hypothetical protein DHS20C14_14290 [Phycisphaeraceae bacterium]